MTTRQAPGMASAMPLPRVNLGDAMSTTTTTTDTTATAPTVTVPLPTVEDYRAADRSGKAAIRSALGTMIEAAAADMGAAIRAKDMPRGIAASERHDSLTALLDSFKSAPSAPTGPDYPQVVADRIATYELAIRLLRTGIRLPEGAPADLPRVAGRADKSTAEALATAKVGKAPKRPLRAMIAQVVSEAGRPLTVAEVCHGLVALTEGAYGDKANGAVTAALLSKSGVEGTVTMPSCAEHVLMVRPA